MTVLRKGRYIGTVNVADVTKEQMSDDGGQKISFSVEKGEQHIGAPALR